MTTIALDAMGGDHGPSVVVPAALAALGRTGDGALGALPHDLKLVLVGDQLALEKELSRHRGSWSDVLRCHHASQQVAMDELPSQALRGKKDSSMRVALDLVKDGTAQACVSAGNTGALMATARFVLKTLPGIDRPAIVSALPSVSGRTHVLDLGANVDTSARHLLEFAVMGSVLATAGDDMGEPSVALLNIGAEEIKGNDQVKEAAALLSASSLNYVGFVEGDDIFRGTADVVVCDGFVGNVALKSSEGVAKMIGTFMREEFQRTFLTRAAYVMASPVLNALRRRMDPRRYNGASFVGLRGIVIKSHGSADVFAFTNAISEAVAELEKMVPDRIREKVAAVLASEAVA